MRRYIEKQWWLETLILFCFKDFLTIFGALTRFEIHHIIPNRSVVFRLPAAVTARNDLSGTKQSLRGGTSTDL